MNANPAAAIAALNRRYLLDYPFEAAQRVEVMDAAEAAELLAEHPIDVILPVWQYLPLDVAETLLALLSAKTVRGVLTELEPSRSAAVLNRLGAGQRDRYLGLLDAQVAKELRMLMSYPADTAGVLMDPRIVTFRGTIAVHEAENRLRAHKPRATRELFLVDAEGRLDARVEIQDLAVADPDQRLSALSRPIITAVQDLAPREEVIDKLEQFKLANLPVIDFAGHLVGVIHQERLVEALAQEASLDIQTMVGASKDERALSTPGFAVKKRLPWLQINLATAFLAAAVVGLFESTIARFTALAVLMPVVAGQAGNSGAQALAVTMRGLALREIGMRHWIRVVLKEVNVGLLNGVAIALTTAAGVYVWSRSFGLSLVIATAMVLSMIAAGFAGALIPIALQRMGHDPAQSSSIILTTVTDITGFLSFLGIATLLAGTL